MGVAAHPVRPTYHPPPGMIRAVLAVLVLLAVAGAGDPAQAQGGHEHRSRAIAREFQREHPCPSTGLPTGACPGYTRDHVVPLCAGGADSVANMQWQTIEDAAAKDVIERRMCWRG